MHLYKKLPVLLLATFIMLAYISCQKELAGDGTTLIIPVDDQAQTTASVQGYVTNEIGQPVNGAVVTSGSAFTTTDVKGYFRFSDIQLSKNNGYVKVTMPGYFTGSRSFITNTGRVNHIRIQLIPKTNAGTIDAAAGGSVTLSSGISISLPAGSVVNTSTNAAYTGTVKVAVAWIDPTSRSLTDQMPGDLRGITTIGSETGLQTFGMVAAELTGSSGELLQIAPGKKATVNFIIPASIISLAPATIALWHFDETAGRWKEDGTATKTGNTYIAEVSHFSFWNCDAKFPLVTFYAKIVNGNNSPLINAQVRIKRVVNNSFGYGITDSSGYVSGSIPANEDLVLEVLDQCGTVIYSQNTGPFSANANLGTITVTTSTTSLITVSGSVTDCSNAPVTKGFVEIYLSSRYYKVAVNNGNYSATITNCSPNATLIIIGVDNVANQQSTPQTITISSQAVVIPAFQACGTSSLQTIDYTVDATAYNIIAPPDSIYTTASGTTTPPNSNDGYIGGYSPTNSTNRITFSFSAPTATPGTYPLKFVSVGQVDSTVITTPSPVINITQYGASGQFIIGNFSVQLKKLSDNSLHPVTCNFKIRRR
ncbi:MAG: carboxypeptidase regulatory-like protein [Chitinophagaceae bacterium]|nr:carboxypeptidase regulatory-like protein [Chitinophagaceae bacterium]